MPRFQAIATLALAASVLSFAPLAASAQGVLDPSNPDVLVVGGTPAGVAAAVSAARRGETVTLVSGSGALGGILTGAEMDQWDLNVTPAGKPVQAGLFTEIYDTLGDAFEPATAEHFFATLIANEPRIAVRYDQVPLGITVSESTDGRRVDGVMFRDLHKNDAVVVHAPVVVDATDDGDIGAMAGARFDLGRQDTGLGTAMQAVTEMFTLTGVDWTATQRTYDPRKFGAGGTTVRTAWGYSKLLKEYRPLRGDIVVRDLNLGRMLDGSVTVNAIDVVGIDGLNPAQVEDAKQQTMHEAPHLVAYLRSRVPGFAQARVGRFAPQVYVRETRHLAGYERLTAFDIWLGRIPADSIGLASYPLDTHPVTANDHPAFAATRHIYGIPLGALLPKGFANLILASPAISATYLAAGSARTIPTTIEEGEAAGAAAALVDRDHLDFEELITSPERVAALREDLVQNGALVGEPTSTVVGKL